MLRPPKRQAVDAQGIWNKTNYIVALKNVDTEGEYLEHIFSPDILNENKTFRQGIFSLYADILGFTPGLDEFYKKRNFKKGEGIIIGLRQKESIRVISKRLGRNQFVISREIKKSSTADGRYQALWAYTLCYKLYFL